MEHAIALQGIVSLLHLGLSTCKQVTGLCVVHLCDELSTTDGLSLADEQTFHHAHARKADSRTLALFDDTHVGHTVISHCWRYDLGLHTDGCFRPIPFLLTAAADQKNSCQHECKLFHLFFIY